MFLDKGEDLLDRDTCLMMKDHRHCARNPHMRPLQGRIHFLERRSGHACRQPGVLPEIIRIAVEIGNEQDVQRCFQHLRKGNRHIHNMIRTLRAVHRHQDTSMFLHQHSPFHFRLYL